MPSAPDYTYVRSVLAVGEARSLFFALLFVRLGYAMITQTVLLLTVDRTGSFGAGGLAAGSFMLLAGVTAPLRGGLVDRFGQTRPLLVYLPAFCTSMALMPLAHSATALVALAGLAGATSPPLIASARPLWRDIVGVERLRSAYALDSVQTQTTMVIGAPVASAVAILLSPAVTPVLLAVVVAIGGTLFLLLPASRAWRSEPRLDHMSSALHAPGMRTLVALAFFIGAVFGALAVSLPAFAAETGSAGKGGILLGVLSLGGVLGGAWWGTRAHTSSPVRALIIATSVMALAVAPMSLVDSPIVIGVLLIVTGFCFGIGNVIGLELIDRAAPPGTAVSAFTWMVLTESAGMAAASAAAGRLAEDVGASAALLVVAAPAVLVPVLLVLRRRTLRAGQWPASSQVAPTPTETSSGTLSG
jgi:predicted MFS family arabinose efflux permease